ncbi:conserved hypothetical protein [Agrobacterium fabacearum S56]|nr:conserved hypothetical protein [Agrobacterium fabacearum S56]
MNYTNCCNRIFALLANLETSLAQLLGFERNEQANKRLKTVDLVKIAQGLGADLAPQPIAACYEISFESDADKNRTQGTPRCLQ